MLVALPLLALGGAVFLARTEWFMQHALPPYLRMLDSESALQNRTCDVLIFGDSTALTGLVPWIIQQDTGLATCNIAQTKGTIGVSGLQFLRQYLHRNPAPRVLVLAFSPEDWRPVTQWGEVAYVEGVLQLVRRRPFQTYAAALATHPNEAFGFVTFVYKSAAQSLVTQGQSAVWPSSGTARDGHMTLPSPPQSACVGGDASPPLQAFTPSPDYVRSLRREFSSKATLVLLISPTIPDCDPRRAYFAATLGPVLDMPIHTQPVGLFNDADRHFTLAGSTLLSHQVAALVLQRLHAEMAR